MILSGCKTIVGLWPHFLRSSDRHDLPHRRPLRHPLQQPQPPQCHQCDAVWFGLSIAVFFNLFWLEAPCKTEKNICGTLTWLKWQFGGTLGGKRTKKSCKFNIWRHPCHLFTTPLCAAAPRLGTTGLLSHITTRILGPWKNSNFDSLQNKQYFLGKGLRKHNI